MATIEKRTVTRETMEKICKEFDITAVKVDTNTWKIESPLGADGNPYKNSAKEVVSEILVEFVPETGKLPRTNSPFLPWARKVNTEFAAAFLTTKQVQEANQAAKEAARAEKAAAEGGEGGDNSGTANDSDKLPTLGKRFLNKYDLAALKEAAKVLAEVISAKQILEANAEKIAKVENQIGTVEDMMSAYESLGMDTPEAVTAKLASLKADLDKAKSGK